MYNGWFSKQEETLVKGWAGFPDSDYNAVTSIAKNELRGKGFNATVRNYTGGDAVLNDLESIITTLQSHNVTPVLITCPNYALLRSFFDSTIVEKNQAVVDYLSKKYGIVYLNYLDDDSFSVSDYHNCDHLNVQGAKKISQKIDSVIMQIESAHE
jgi:hypothetical protein